ncbi:MAG TPA: phospholipid carrier-dependent glycosyltransferase [Pseudolysinimonas sp.]|nr:phospholipid carrier-dependent glycosyltransferase [Pseudolysinimonas sp.]
MTITELTGSRLDDWWDMLMRRRYARTIWCWGGPFVVVIVAALLRLVGLAYPHELVFDETYYVKDAWTLMHLGYEGLWGADPNVAFNAGDPNGYQSSPEFLAHPPLGKWVISIGLALFGGGSSFGWRFSTAIVGIILVILTMVIAWMLFRSTLLTVIAGGLIAIDGNAIVLSRVSLLDGIVALFALIGVILVLLDRQWSARRLERWMSRRTAAGRSTAWGPALWWRPWLILAALSFGLTSGVKWSGVYFLAGLAIYSVVADLLARRRAGIAHWSAGTILKQGPATFLIMVPLAAVTYVSVWVGWFVTGNGYDRHWAEQAANQWHGLLSWVPIPFQSWYHFQAEIYNYNINLHTPHSYQAYPLTWLFEVRPTSMFYQDLGNGSSSQILDIANPLIWWACTAAALFLLVRAIWGAWRGRSVWREAFILTAIAAGYLPWVLFYSTRTVFQFYTIAFEPYLILALTAALGILLGSSADAEARRVVGLRVVGVFLGVCALLSLFFLPMWTGTPIPHWFVQLHYWFRSWI